MWVSVSSAVQASKSVSRCSQSGLVLQLVCCELCRILTHFSPVQHSHITIHHGRVAGPNLQQTRPEDLEEEQVQADGEDYRQKDRQELVSLSPSLYHLECWLVSSDGGAVAISLFNRDNNDSEQEQEEKERLKTEREERIQKNKDWRQRLVHSL